MFADALSTASIDYFDLTGTLIQLWCIVGELAAIEKIIAAIVTRLVTATEVK